MNVALSRAKSKLVIVGSLAFLREAVRGVVARYRGTVKRRYFRGDAAFANPEIYEFLEAEGYGYAIRLPTNRVVQEKIGYLLARPLGRPPLEVRRYYASFAYQAGSWKKPRRVVAKVEWHPGELCPRVGFIVTNLARPPERIVGFYNHRGTCEQYIKEGKGAIKWTRLSCRAAAEHYVMCQLLRRNMIAALTPAGVPDADIIASDRLGGTLAAVQVKSRRDIGSDGGWRMKAKHESMNRDLLFYRFVDFGN